MPEPDAPQHRRRAADTFDYAPLCHDAMIHHAFARSPSHLFST